ncbi:hypothetical protein TNIN_194371 [Trichonephila inaurata madagascariensis]|uniref:Uncharacterized protein n=1 Tax=Trichonephila inaurata madagascariensis TaxID=2747483 RepID=A0A8X6Y3S2_9ARAC|nr:hypothetical protein TNIN_194371 [Trichonephila inaurata madagascariensis]
MVPPQLSSLAANLVSHQSRSFPFLALNSQRVSLLLAQLVEKVRLSTSTFLAKIILHTDSTIAIAWSNTPANQLKTFVGNRSFQDTNSDGELE